MGKCVDCGDETDSKCPGCNKYCCESCLKPFSGRTSYCKECTTNYGDSDN